MRVGIVGAEGAKFTPHGEAQARKIIRELLTSPDTVLVSGRCHLGGIDIWAEEEADRLGRDKDIFPPAHLRWEGGYKQRNLLIARTSDIVHCIAVDRLPNKFKGIDYGKGRCYHCNTSDHVKSGGCWTMLRCKVHQLHIVSNAESVL